MERLEVKEKIFTALSVIRFLVEDKSEYFSEIQSKEIEKNRKKCLII